MREPVSEDKTFSIDARAILTLGRDSIKDHTTALLELVKNSYDADATRVEIDIFCVSSDRYIRVADNGCGMTEEEVNNYWLRIGYSEKRTKRFSDANRRKTGEKGIGRISADRLGAILQLKTQAKNNKALGLQVNWDDFNVEGKDLSSIPVRVLKNPVIMLPSVAGNTSSVELPFVVDDAQRSGTELIIRELRQNWTLSNIEDLYAELSILTPPFKQAVSDFELYLKTDVTTELQGKVQSPFYQTAEIELNAKWDGTNVNYTIKDRYSKKGYTEASKIDYKQLVQKATESGETDASVYPKMGPVAISLLFYPREAKLLEGTDFRLSDLREFLDKNSGVRIYRDFVRVKPYGNPGDPEGDWLGLAERKTREPAGVGRPTWRVGANQLVGAVFVSRDGNPTLIDSSSREGLIQGDAFHDLRSIVLGCLTLLETYRHKEYVEREPQDEKPAPTQVVESLRKELTVLKSDLKAVTKEMAFASSHKPIRRALDQVISVTEKTLRAGKALEEMLSEGRILRGLATIGIASAVFGHETKSSVSEFISATYTASRLLKRKQPDIDGTAKELAKAIKYADQVASWGSFALARIQRDKRRRRKIDVGSLVEETIKEIDPIFKAANINIKPKLETTVVRAFAMDVESVLLNLLTNSYEASQQTNRPRVVQVTLLEKSQDEKRGFELSVADSGPGVEQKLKRRIWDPLFTTRVDRNGKQVGTGLGLTIVKSIVDELGGKRWIERDAELKGARFTIWIPE